MGRIVWLGLLLVSLVSCNFSPQGSDVSVEQKPVINMTVNGKSVYEFVESTSVDLLNAFPETERMDLGYLLTKEQLESLPQAKQNAVRPNQDYIPFDIRNKEPPIPLEDLAENESFVYLINGTKVTPIEFLKLMDISALQNMTLAEKQYILSKVGASELADLPLAVQNALK